MARCTQCGHSDATKQMPATGRAVCPACWKKFVQIAAVGMGATNGTGGAATLATAVVAGQYANVIEQERAAAEQRRAKLAATEGFWRRMWVRIVG